MTSRGSALVWNMHIWVGERAKQVNEKMCYHTGMFSKYSNASPRIEIAAAHCTSEEITASTYYVSKCILSLLPAVETERASKKQPEQISANIMIQLLMLTGRRIATKESIKFASNRVRHQTWQTRAFFSSRVSHLHVVSCRHHCHRQHLGEFPTPTLAKGFSRLRIKTHERSKLFILIKLLHTWSLSSISERELKA